MAKVLNTSLKFLCQAVIPVWLCVLGACTASTDESAYTYDIAPGSNMAEIKLDGWYVTGPFTRVQDSLQWRDFMDAPQHSTLEANPDTTVRLWHNGSYTPKYGNPDLKEVFAISVNDTTRALDTLVTYLSCILRSETERDVYLNVKKEMACTAFINGDTIHRLPIKTMEVYPLHLKAGENMLFVKAKGQKRRYFYDATILDSTAFARLYAEQHTGNIINPIINNDTITLTEGHADITDGAVRLFFHDVYGRKSAELTLQKDTLKYCVHGLSRNHAYICSMVMAGDTVRQPVMTGSVEEVEAHFWAMRDSLPDSHPRAEEIDQLMYRVWKLSTVTGKMREDKWFPFKLPWVFYQLEHTFAHLDGTYGNDEGEYNLQFLTYRSQLDGCPQRYILVTPNHVDRNRKYPLVLVVRPNGDKRHHLFACQQIANQNVVNDLQTMAERYGVFCIMPEARMMKDEDLTPFTEAEMKLAVADVQEHYNIDPDRIYLVANCSGAYRALRLAEQNPGIFAAMALYAPTYVRSEQDNTYTEFAPEVMVENLRGMPILVFGDPTDVHSPLKGYMPLVEEMKDKGVKVRLTLRRNTAHGAYGYHRIVLGREALEFFEGIRRRPINAGSYIMPPRDTTVADFYGRPFIYVYNAADTSAVYRKLVDDIRDEYENYLYARLPFDSLKKDVRMPLIPDTRVTRGMLEDRNVFLIGERFECQNVNDFAHEVAKGKPSVKPGEVMLTACDNPYNKDGMALLYTSGKGPHFGHLINYPWIQGFNRTLEKKIIIE